MNFDEIWNNDGALSSCSRDDAEDFYNEGAKCQQAKIDLLEKELTETQAFLNKQNHIKQTKIDELQARVDKVVHILTYTNHASTPLCNELRDILKGNKDEN